MARYLNGGYIMLDLTDASVYVNAVKAVKAGKPVMVYNESGVPFYAKKLVLVGSVVAIDTEAGVFAIASDGTISNSKAVANIQAIPSAVLSALECGDILVKVTGKQKHSYRVSYKEDGVSICLTYVDASLVETVSYDYTDGAWVYNSTDSTPLGE